MKKTLIALAAVVAAGGTFAQSTVSLTGGISFGYQSVDTLGAAAVAPAVGVLGAAAAPSKTTRGMGATDGSLYVNVSEDLGGGMKVAGFMNFDNGPSQFNDTTGFNRRAMGLSVGGGFGTISFANTRGGDLLTNAYTMSPVALPDGIYDSTGILTRAPIDILTYTTPNFSGFTGSLSYVEAGTDGLTTFSTTISVLGLNYANGPLAVSFAFKNTAWDSTVATAAFQRSTNSELFASYDFGVAKVALGWDSAQAGKAAYVFNPANPNNVGITNDDASAWAFGVSVPLGAVTVGASYAARDFHNIYGVGIKYDLSKRTNVNFSFGKQTFDASAGSNGGVATDGNQYRLALNHAF